VVAAKDDNEIGPSLWVDVADVPIKNDPALSYDRFELIEELAAGL
jgi:hypothetical protein